LISKAPTSLPTGSVAGTRISDERFGLSALIAENIRDDRRGKNTQSPLPDLL